MTENKRFTVCDGFDGENNPIKTIEDTVTTEIYSMDNELEANSVCIKLNELNDENGRLQHFESIYRQRTLQLEKENEQLKTRNDNQAKQLDNLYQLIEQKDWRALTKIIDDFKQSDEQLQKEWGTYGDVE